MYSTDGVHSKQLEMSLGSLTGSYSSVSIQHTVVCCNWFVCDSIKLSLPDYLRVGFDCAHYAFYVLLPVTGWVGESWLGRYHFCWIDHIMYNCSPRPSVSSCFHNTQP